MWNNEYIFVEMLWGDFALIIIFARFLKFLSYLKENVHHQLSNNSFQKQLCHARVFLLRYQVHPHIWSNE